jgi:hypothetical protein
MDDKLDDTLGELGGLMYRAALLRAEMTNDEYLNYVHCHGDGPQLMYDQLYGVLLGSISAAQSRARSEAQRSSASRYSTRVMTRGPAARPTPRGRRAPGPSPPQCR